MYFGDYRLKPLLSMLVTKFGGASGLVYLVNQPSHATDSRRVREDNLPSAIRPLEMSRDILAAIGESFTASSSIRSQDSKTGPVTSTAGARYPYFLLAALLMKPMIAVATKRIRPMIASQIRPLMANPSTARMAQMTRSTITKINMATRYPGEAMTHRVLSGTFSTL